MTTIAGVEITPNDKREVRGLLRLKGLTWQGWLASWTREVGEAVVCDVQPMPTHLYGAAVLLRFEAVREATNRYPAAAGVA